MDAGFIHLSFDYILMPLLEADDIFWIDW